MKKRPTTGGWWRRTATAVAECGVRHGGGSRRRNCGATRSWDDGGVRSNDYRWWCNQRQRRLSEC
ncbi:hypothetical protein Hanom_Chr02g00125591 [Helianthus anomalus]